MRFSVLLVVASLFAASGVSLRAQSLAEVAKKEEERRKHVPAAGKVYTNKDLKPVPEAPPTPDAGVTDSTGSLSVSGPSTDAKPAGDAVKGAPPTTAGAKGKAQEEPKGEAYWRTRMFALRDNLDRTKTLVAALESRLNGLNNDFASRDDPAQRAVLAQEHDKALDELDRMRRAVTSGSLEIAEAEEEARRAGVPPGWLR